MHSMQRKNQAATQAALLSGPASLPLLALLLRRLAHLLALTVGAYKTGTIPEQASDARV
jgi:hypothetical protein